MTSPPTTRRSRAHPTRWYHSGEIVVAAELGPDMRVSDSHRQIRAALEGELAGHAGGVFSDVQSRQEPILFRAPGRPTLAFFFFDLREEHQLTAVGDAVKAMHALDLEGDWMARTGARQVAPMPHWFSLAQQDCVGGSPGSAPRPVPSDELPGDRARWRYVYRVAQRDLDFGSRARHLTNAQRIPVVVLDTVPDQKIVAAAVDRYRHVNAQLESLSPVVEGATPATPAVALRVKRVEEQQLQLAPSSSALAPYSLSDHGLFVLGLVRSVAPDAPVQLLPVLSSSGVGDLETLLRTLSHVISSKPVTQPIIINLSLGMLPALEHLPFFWFGGSSQSDSRSETVTDAGASTSNDTAWLRANHVQVRRASELLHSGLERLADYLLDNNCLVVAAAGNDSFRRVEAGRPRLGPRIPARYRSVLGVAATTMDDTAAATYSNMSDEWGFGDHVATFGGDVDPSGEPVDGLLSVYSQPCFPSSKTGKLSHPATNTTGWARWSGTSFATAIVSGLAANLWAVGTATSEARLSAADLLEEVGTEAADFAPLLGASAFAVRGAWEKAP
ncbi:MAG: S8/S53 family peptidase [Chloroflexi bacterium]|nr:S8/S53 family peptidase [Chloroflexota bacterium]